MKIKIVDLNTIVTYADALRPDCHNYHLLVLERRQTRLCIALIKFQEKEILWT